MRKHTTHYSKTIFALQHKNFIYVIIFMMCVSVHGSCALLRVGQAIGQVQHVHFLVCDPS